MENSTTEIERAIKIAAKIVVSSEGEIYLPIFNRLHEELSKIQKQKETKSIAINLAQSYADLE